MTLYEQETHTEQPTPLAVRIILLSALFRIVRSKVFDWELFRLAPERGICGEKPSSLCESFASVMSAGAGLTVDAESGCVAL